MNKLSSQLLSIVICLNFILKYKFFSLLAVVASENDTPVFKIKSWRKGENALPEIVDQYKQVDAELNVLPFCSQFIPMEVIEHPKYKSICYHPSILPKHRGVSAINW